MIDRAEDIAKDFAFYLDQQLKSLARNLPEEMARTADVKVQTVIDVVKKYGDTVARASQSKRYTGEGLSERRTELAAEADVELRAFETNVIAKTVEQIRETEKAMTFPADTPASLEERVDPFNYQAYLRHMKEAEIRSYLHKMDYSKLLALYHSDDLDSYTIGAIENCPSFMSPLPSEVTAKRQAARRQRQHPEAAARLEQLETLKSFYSMAVGYARQQMGIKVERAMFNPAEKTA